jgi:AcrR family transcriptional regulator
MQPRTRRHLRTRQAILDAALEIINQDGPEALSMRTLAERIDYSPAGLYEYFGGKEEIISAVCEEGQRALHEAMSQVDPTLPPSAYLYEIGQAYIRFALAHPDYFLMMFTLTPPAPTSYMSPESQPEAAQSEPTAYDILVQAVQRGLDAGAFHERPGFGLEEITYAAWALVHGMAMLRVTALRDFPADLSPSDHEALFNFMRGLQAA